MKILILSTNYWPEVTGIGAFTTYRAEYLAAAGHDVEVCTAFPYYPEWKVPPAYSGKLFASETRNRVRIRRSFAYIPSHASLVKRILHEASFVTSAIARAVFCNRPEVLLVVSPPLRLAVPAILLSRLWRIPYVFDVEDLQPDSAADLGMLPRPTVKLLYGLESMAYRHARLVTTLTATMRDRIAGKGVPKDKSVLIEPRLDESLSDISPEERRAFRARLAAGRPVIASVSSENEVARIATESGAGTVAEAESGVHLLNAILELRKSNLVEMGICARAFAFRRWSSERVLGDLERSLAGAAFPMRSLAHKETSK